MLRVSVGRALPFLQACILTIYVLSEINDMALILRGFIFLLISVWCVAQERTGDGRVILNLGYFATYSGSYVSSGK